MLAPGRKIKQHFNWKIIGFQGSYSLILIGDYRPIKNDMRSGFYVATISLTNIAFVCVCVFEIEIEVNFERDISEKNLTLESFRRLYEKLTRLGNKLLGTFLD